MRCYTLNNYPKNDVPPLIVWPWLNIIISDNITSIKLQCPCASCKPRSYQELLRSYPNTAKTIINIKHSSRYIYKKARGDIYIPDGWAIR